MRSIMDTKKHPDYSDAYQKIYGSLEEKKSGMSSDAMSSILKGNRYSGKELFNMSKKSTQQGRHGEAHALYKEFQKKKSTKEEVEPRVGRHRAEFERYKEELKEDHVSKFNAWVENLQKEGFDVTRWDPEELIDTYIKENDLWTSRKSVIEAVGDGYPARREGPQKGLGTALCPTCGQFGCNKDHEAEKEAEVKEEFKALTPDKKDQIRNQAERRKKSADRAQNASDYKTSTKQDQQVRKMKSVLKNEEWKPDPVEKRQKKAADLHRRETIAQDTPTKYKTDKTEDPDKLYKRRMAVGSKTKMRNEGVAQAAGNAIGYAAKAVTGVIGQGVKGFSNPDIKPKVNFSKNTPVKKNSNSLSSVQADREKERQKILAQRIKDRKDRAKKPAKPEKAAKIGDDTDKKDPTKAPAVKPIVAEFVSNLLMTEAKHKCKSCGKMYTGKQCACGC